MTAQPTKTPSTIWFWGVGVLGVIIHLILDPIFQGTWVIPFLLALLVVVVITWRFAQKEPGLRMVVLVALTLLVNILGYSLIRTPDVISFILLLVVWFLIPILLQRRQLFA